MSEVTIKSVPEGAEEEVKRLAVVAIERFLKRRDCVVDAAAVTKYEQDVDAVLEANTLEKKYDKE